MNIHGDTEAAIKRIWPDQADTLIGLIRGTTPRRTLEAIDPGGVPNGSWAIPSEVLSVMAALSNVMGGHGVDGITPMSDPGHPLQRSESVLYVVMPDDDDDTLGYRVGLNEVIVTTRLLIMEELTW